jgi:arylsulfatase A-like enzyme
MMTRARNGSRRGPYLNDGGRSSVPDGPSAATPAAGRFRSLTRLSPKAAVLLAIALGLCGGYLDLSLILVRKTLWRETLSLHNGRDFAWTIPLSLAIVMLIPGFLIATLNWLRPRLISVRAASWLFATLAIWAALLRLPLYGACSLLLAAGLGRTVGNAVAARLGHWRTVRFTLTGILGLLAVLAALTSGRLTIREHLAVAGLSPAPPRARNVVLIVWDTVRAYNLSTYGYARNTTPNLTRLASEGVRYHFATAPAPWTYPSHSSFFTGQWPFKLNSQWKFTLDTPSPTLAEYLASRGYQTAGFSANTYCCNYDNGLARGFAHFEDFPLTPRTFLGRTFPGNWMLKHILYRGNYHDMKWIDVQAPGARGTSEAFLSWLADRRPDRPFFAFINYFDAHDPYLPPPGFEGRFGIRPKPPRDYNFLYDYMSIDKDSMTKRDIAMARDCYDDCIAFLDEQLGRLIDQLRSRGLLDDTVVIIASDHGEAFGDHKRYGHSSDLHLDEIGVPLVILSPGAPAGRVVDNPVSLRDLPATVVDQIGLAAGSPFPGQSLASYWHSSPGQMQAGNATPALSDLATATAFELQPAGARGHNGFQMSLLASGHHYIRDGVGMETLYDLKKDPFEQANLIGTSSGDNAVAAFRKLLFDVLTANPGSIEVETAYLKTFKRELESQIREIEERQVAAGN